MAELARPRARDPVGPHPDPTPTGALSALGDLQRRLLPPSGAHALLGPPALGTAAAGLDPGRAGLLCAGERPPDAADRRDAAPRPRPKPLAHAAAGGSGGAARLLAGPPGHGRGRHPARVRGSRPHPVAWLAAGPPPRPVDRRPRLSRARPEALPEAAALSVHPPTGGRGAGGGPAPAAGRPARCRGAAGGEAAVPGPEGHLGRAARAGAPDLPGRH